jgi:hypothetical protein
MRDRTAPLKVPHIKPSHLLLAATIVGGLILSAVYVSVVYSSERKANDAFTAACTSATASHYSGLQDRDGSGWSVEASKCMAIVSKWPYWVSGLNIILVVPLLFLLGYVTGRITLRLEPPD